MRRAMPSLVFVVLSSLLPGQGEPRVLEEAGTVFRTSVALGDVDGDGIADLVIGQNGSFQLRRGIAGDGPGRRFQAAVEELTPRVECTCEHAGQPRLVDVDRDGDLDLLTLHTPFGRSDQVVWFANDGKGGFGPARGITAADGAPFEWAQSGQARAIELVDWDGDGHADLIVATPQLILHRGGATGFAARGEPLGCSAEAFAIADCDGDGVPDLLTVPPSTTSSSAVTLQLRRGGILQPGRVVLPFTGDTGQAQLAVADWNADGRPDVLLAEVLHEPPAPAPDEAAAGEPKAKAQAGSRPRYSSRVRVILL
jgi:hypothetical protein